MLSFIHSRRVAHDLMVLAVLAMEAFFAWRASLMYVFILTGRVNALELEIIRWLVFLAVGVFGFALATHRHAGIEAIRAHQQANWSSLWGLFLAVGIVVLHDVAATVYTVGDVNSFGAIAAVVGMCGLVFLPFLVGFMSHTIAAGIEKENKERNRRKIDGWKEQAELRYWKKHYKQDGFQPQFSVLAQVPSVEEDVQEEISDADMEAVTSTGMPKWLPAEQVAAMLGIPVFQAESRMNPKYRGKFERIKSREFIVQRKPVRKAYYKTVEALQEKENVQVSA
jgi:hypothetical protein